MFIGVGLLTESIDLKICTTIHIHTNTDEIQDTVPN